MNLENAALRGQGEFWHRALGETATILLVEDEAFVRNVTCEVLEAAGYRVMAAENSAEGDSLHEKHCDEIDLLITDAVLPDQNGQALAAKLRSRNPALKVLLVTGYADQMKRLQAQAFEYLAKPFSSADLVVRVKQLTTSLNLLRVEGGNPDLGEPALRHVCGIESL